MDDYFWLRDRGNPDVMAYLEAENAWTPASCGTPRGLQEQLYQEMGGRIQETDLSVPERDGRLPLLQSHRGRRQYPIFCRRRDEAGARGDPAGSERAGGRATPIAGSARAR